MRTKHVLLLIFTGIILLSATSLVGCGSMELTSTWRDREVTIDGVDAEWRKTMVWIEDKNVAIGLLNDEEYIYVCLASTGPTRIRQIIAMGFTIWFDPQGGKDKTFGIHCPLGAQDLSLLRGETPDSEKLQEMLEKTGKELEIFGPGKGEHLRMPVLGSQEIHVQLGYLGGKLVYELRVPLVQDEQHPNAVGVGASETIGIGFETAELDREMMRERRSGDMSSGGRGMRGGGMSGGGRRGGGRSGGGRGGGGRRGGGMPERLELWTKVQLASGGVEASK